MAVTTTRIQNPMELERHEAKYLIHPSQVDAIRDFVRPFVVPDDNADEAGLPEYMVTTLQFDTPSLSLYYAKEHESLNRFKLRVRTYGTDGTCPVFMEIKRKIKGIIVKSRATVPPQLWSKDIVLHPKTWIPFRSIKEHMNYLNFVRLVQETGARPILLVRYIRESYLGKYDRYSRLTFDRSLCYQPARGWDVLPKDGHWWSMDSCTAQNRPFSGMILELKTFGDAPLWMVDMTERFNLVRVGFCKYFTAMRMEMLTRGSSFSDSGENCTY